MHKKLFIILLLKVFLFSIISIVNAEELSTIIYTSYELPNYGQLCSVDADGNNHICISSKKEFHSPYWSPDGNKVVVGTGYHDEIPNIVILKSNGDLISILKNSSGFYRPLWHPDGSIYALNYDLGRSVRKWDLSTGKYKDILIKGSENEYKFLQMIAFSPSGKFAALLTDEFKVMLIAEVGEESITVIKVLPKKFEYIAQSVWLDDNNILFIGQIKSDTKGLWEFNILDDMLKKVDVQELFLDDCMALSPDKKAIIVSATKGEQDTKWNLWIYNLETKNVNKITNGVEDVEPSWRSGTK